MVQAATRKKGFFELIAMNPVGINGRVVATISHLLNVHGNSLASASSIAL